MAYLHAVLWYLTRASQVARLTRGACFGISELEACPPTLEGYNAEIVAKGSLLAVCVQRTADVSKLEVGEPSHGRCISPVSNFEGGNLFFFTPRCLVA